MLSSAQTVLGKVYVDAVGIILIHLGICNSMPVFPLKIWPEPISYELTPNLFTSVKLCRQVGPDVSKTTTIVAAYWCTCTCVSSNPQMSTCSFISSLSALNCLLRTIKCTV